MNTTRMEQLSWIDPLADRFEKSWKDGSPPRLEEYLEAAPEGQREALLRELLPVELHHRHQREEVPKLAEYEQRFPQHLALVRAVFAGTPTAMDTLPLSPGPVPGARPLDRRCGRYALSRLHGEGGLGQIWVAQDEELDREVALKALRPQHADDAHACQRFVREAQVTGQLEHPNIVPVYELSRQPDSGQPFYTMRLVRGRTLREELSDYHAHRRCGKADPLALPRLLTAFVSVCQAVGFAHARGVLHRDLKPENVMVGSFGEVVVLDWGLARTLQTADTEARAGSPMRPDSRPDMTAPGCVLGTPAYMAPEQAQGRVDLIDAQTDIYGLGAILFEIVTGHPPREGKDTSEVLLRVIEDPTPRARSVEPSVPPALDAICARAMARERAARYPCVADLAEDVQRFLADEPVSVFREPWTHRLTRCVRRHRTTAVAVAAAFAGVLVASVLAALALAQYAQEEYAARVAAEQAREQGIRVTARFAARTVAREVALRWAVLEGAAADPELRRLLAGLLTVEDLNARPEIAQLQAWLERQHKEHYLTTRATSWFLTDARGRHLGLFPNNGRLIGQDFAYRDYFHGTGKNLSPATRDIQPLRDVYCSLVYESKLPTHERLVAFAVPVWAEKTGPPKGRVLAVLAMTVELGNFGALQTALGKDQIAVLVDTREDWFSGEGQKGLILHHPYLEELSRREGPLSAKLPVIRLDPARVEQLEQLRQKAFAWESAMAKLPWQQQVSATIPDHEGLERNYRDPVGGAYGGTWLAAFEPVIIKRRANNVKDIGWVVIVQERRAKVRAEE